MEYLILQVKEQQVDAVRFVASGRAMSLAGAASFELDDQQDLAAVAKRIAAGLSGSPRIVLCLPPDMFAQRVIELPLTDLRKVREVLPVHMQGEIALQPEEAVFDVLPSTDGRFMALWARHTDLARILTLFAEAGVEPQIISSAMFAWSYLPGLGESCIVSDGSALTVISSGRPVYMRAFEAGEPLSQLTATLSALELSTTPLPSELVVFGPHADTLAEHSFRGKRLELPEELGTTFRTDDNFQQLAGLYAVAAACHDGALPDFRRGDLAWTAGDARLRRKILISAILAGVAILLLFVYKGIQYRQARTDLASLNSSISSIYREIFPTRAKAVDELAEVKGEIRKLTGMDSSSSFLDVLKQLAEAKGATINGLYEAELDGNVLRIKGDARSAQAVNEFRAVIAPMMATVEMGEVKGRADGTVSFSLSGTVQEVKR